METSPDISNHTKIEIKSTIKANGIEQIIYIKYTHRFINKIGHDKTEAMKGRKIWR